MNPVDSLLGINRRKFLKHTGAAIGAAGMLSGCATQDTNHAAPTATHPAFKEPVSIVRDPADAIATSAPAQWAIQKLVDSLTSRNISCKVVDRISDAPSGLCIVVVGSDSDVARQVLNGAHVTMPDFPESLALVPGSISNRSIILAGGRDARGLVYALTELSDRVDHASSLTPNFDVTDPIVEQPANKVRGMMRAFTSDVEDKAWYNDREAWKRYLSMLVSERFNRFNLAFGVGYDFARNVKDAYFYFAYPFLLAVPGYDVRVTNLPDEERDNNLKMLRFISDEAAARGLHFQLGIWTHAYIWTDSPGVNHTIEGLTNDKHAAYSRDALELLLQSCPSISGVTFRIHGESGVAEGNYDFWKTVFDGAVQCGRKIEIDMHAKGMDQAMIDVALGTGLPVSVSPKTWAEHMGLPYHQAGIRPVELPRPNRADPGFFSRSSGSRSFLRYGYGDLLTEDRKYAVIHRTWPGTQRLLLWGDPAFAAAYASFGNFCGSDGLELFEPLSFKGRKGSGLPGGRDAYADATLKPKTDWEKYLYTFRLWGRLLYNPTTKPEAWQRMLRKQMGEAAPAAETALSDASRILPLITTAHLPSAANNNYWPEIYTNMSIVDASHPGPYSDTPNPKRFGAVSPLDPEMFLTVDQCADEFIKGDFSGKYSPVEVARWLLEMIGASGPIDQTERFGSQFKSTVEYERLKTDVLIQQAIAYFFATKFYSAVAWAIYAKTGYRPAGEQAIAMYQSASKSWATLATASKVYVPDITFGLEHQLRGHWQDRLPAIDADIAAMQERFKQRAGKTVSDKIGAAALARVTDEPKRPEFAVEHQAPKTFKRGQEIALEFTAANVALAKLHYRRVNQAEAFGIVPMEAAANRFAATIPAAYTDSPFPMQYYFELRDASGGATIWPGFDKTLTRQPYIVVRQTKA